MGFVMLLFGGILFLAAVGSFLWARHKQRMSLLIDAKERALKQFDGSRPTLAVPFAAVTGVRRQQFDSSDFITSYDVLVTLGASELCVHQSFDGDAAEALGRQLAQLLGVPWDPHVEKKG
jgi:hypothetical protein